MRGRSIPFASPGCRGPRRRRCSRRPRIGESASISVAPSFAETAGGVTIAGLRQALERGLLDPDESTVAFITGGGLKTTDAVVDHVTQPIPGEGTLKSFEDACAAAGKN